ncbi:MAG: hypothetical protein K6E47_01530 [Lachnospiraceae bacterium]|nr:hypothetical protein [Lachnospiraceae bacterium]
MPLTKAQCTNCGGLLEVDSSKEAAVCPHCGTPYIVEKAINNYQTIHTYNINNAVIENVDQEYIRLKKQADYCLEKSSFDEAETNYKQILEKYRFVDPHNFFLSLKASTHNFSVEYYKQRAQKSADRAYESRSDILVDGTGKGSLEDKVRFLKEGINSIKQNPFLNEYSPEELQIVRTFITRLENELKEQEKQLEVQQAEIQKKRAAYEEKEKRTLRNLLIFALGIPEIIGLIITASSDMPMKLVGILIMIFAPSLFVLLYK